MVPYTVIISEEACAINVSIDLQKTQINPHFGEFLGIRFQSPINLEFKVIAENLKYFLMEEVPMASLSRMMAAATITKDVVRMSCNNPMGAVFNEDYDRIDPTLSSYMVRHECNSNQMW